MKKPEVCFVSAHPNAVLPVYGSAEAAGADIRSVESHVIYPQTTRIVKTGLNCSIPSGYELQVRPRSGLAAKNGITVLNAPGTIDSDYTGEICVMLHNTSRVPFSVEVGDRIAQIVVAPVVQADFGWTTEARETERGTGGFGSTGVK